MCFITFYRDLIGMEPKRGSGRPPKRVALETVADIGSTHDEAAQDLTQSEKDKEIKRLRFKNQRLQEKVARGKSQTSSTSVPMPSAPKSRRVARRTTDEEEVSLRDFLRYGTPEYRGEIGEDPQEFLKETKKVIKRLSCSSTKAVELVDMRMKENAWNWYQRYMED